MPGPVVPVQELRRISVTATRGAREVENIAGTVTIIDDEQIEAQLARDLHDLLRYEPGLSVANSANRFGQAGINIRGIDGNRVLMRIDAVPMADEFAIGSFSDARRNLIDLDAVKSVEIVRGAASALYGSDAIGGVVSFILKDPLDYLEPDSSTYFSARSGYQSDDAGWFGGGTAAFGGEDLSALVLYTRRTGHELDNQGESGARDRTRTKPNPQDYDSHAVLAKVLWNPDDRHALQFAVAGDRSDVDTQVLSSVGVAGTVNTLGMRGDDQQRRWRASLQHDIEQRTTWFDHLQWRAFSQRSELEQRTLEQRYSLTAGPVATVERDRTFTFEQEIAGAELVLTKDVDLGATHHRLTYGLDASRTRTEQMRNGLQTNLASGAQTSNIPPDDFPVRDFPLTDTDEYAVYAQDEIALGDWLLIPAVRFDRYELDPEPDAIFVADNPGVATAGLRETSTSPKLGLIYSVNDSVSLFAQYARGFRAPPYDDVNIGFTNLAFGYTAIANPDLEPERSNGYEIGVRSEFEHGYLSLAGFWNDYDDFIESLAFVGVENGLQVFQSRNLASARIYGAELKGAAHLAAWSERLADVSLRFSAGWGRGKDRVTGAPLNSVDPLKAVLGLTYAPTSLWSIEAIATAVDRKSPVDHGAATLFVPDSYFTLDVLARVDLGERLRLNAGIFNLTDETYWEWADVRGRPATDTTLDRYTRPGVNASIALSVVF